MKNKLFKLYGFLHAVKHPIITGASIKSLFDETVYDNKIHLKLAGDWLLWMQNNDGGYSRKFSLISGRDKSYIETTGYIIPSLINLGKFLKDEKYINSALKAGEFLLKVQNSDGSFSEIDSGKPFAFDTGQCLMGLNYLFEYTKENKYLQSARKAAYWLKDTQEGDGSWKRVAYNKEKHTYYSRVAAALYKFSLFENDLKIQKVALKHIKWVINNQLENGFFRYSSFLEEEPPFLHTLMYVIEGLLDIYEINKDETILNAILNNTNSFKDINLNRDLILCSQYNERFYCINKERCVTGLAQWAGVALRLFQITRDEDYKTCAINTLYYLKAKQIKFSIMKGGFTASIPFWGRYGSFDYVNWSNKFFIDSLILYEKLRVSRVAEQESFVSSAFGLTDVVTDNVSYMDKEYLNRVKLILKNNQKVLDIGAGKGTIINELRKQFDSEFIGIDPVFEGGLVKRGSIYNIPFEDNSFDVVMVFEVLQHTFLEDALKEIYRVMKKNGMLIIGERNPLSIFGFLKPFYEIIGNWMYPFDSPFKEKWYFKEKWIYNLKKSGFEVEEIETIEGNGKKFVNRYFFIRSKK